jgi:hypothetical protein
MEDLMGGEEKVERPGRETLRTAFGIPAEGPLSQSNGSTCQRDVSEVSSQECASDVKSATQREPEQRDVCTCALELQVFR